MVIAPGDHLFVCYPYPMGIYCPIKYEWTSSQRKLGRWLYIDGRFRAPGYTPELTH